MNMASSFKGVIVAQVHGVTIVMLRMHSIMEGTEIHCVAQTLNELVDEKAVRKLIVDFRAVRYIASQMLSTLIDLNRNIQAIGGELVLLGLNPRLTELFRITGIEKIFSFAPTEKAAFQKLHAA